MERFLQVAVLVSALVFPSVSQAQKLEKIRVTLASMNSIYYPHFIAVAKGYYRDEGLEIEIIKAGGGVATPALAAGEIQFSTSSGSALAGIIRGLPLKVVYVNIDRPLYWVYTNRPEIRTVADLKGKRLAIQSRGDTMEVAASHVLRQNGLDPVRDVIWVAVGTGANRLSALQAGAIETAVLAFADRVMAQQEGKLREVVDLGREVRMLYTGLATSDRLLKERNELARGFIRATVKGREFFKAYKEESLRIGEKYDRQGTSEVRSADFDATLKVMSAGGEEDLETQKKDIESSKTLLKIAAEIAPERVFDFNAVRSVYQELKAKGWRP